MKERVKNMEDTDPRLRAEMIVENMIVSEKVKEEKKMDYQVE